MTFYAQSTTKGHQGEIIIIIISCIYNAPNDALSANIIHIYIYTLKTTILYTHKTENLTRSTTHEEHNLKSIITMLN